MYATPEEIREYLSGPNPKPMLLCEYMHDMGNSLGGMEEYIQLQDEFAQYQGGFIWDFKDQALWRTDPLGRRVLGYGGDFGDRPSDYNFSANGILFADGREKPRHAGGALLVRGRGNAPAAGRGQRPGPAAGGKGTE